jgi:hypothetical protein
VVLAELNAKGGGVAVGRDKGADKRMGRGPLNTSFYGFRNSSGSLAIFAAMRRRLSRVSNVCFTPKSGHRNSARDVRFVPKADISPRPKIVLDFYEGGSRGIRFHEAAGIHQVLTSDRASAAGGPVIGFLNSGSSKGTKCEIGDENANSDFIITA